MLDGWKTYIVALIAGAAWIAQQMGYIDQDTFNKILGILAPLGLAALRDGVKKSGPVALPPYLGTDSSADKPL